MHCIFNQTVMEDSALAPEKEGPKKKKKELEQRGTGEEVLSNAVF